MGDINGPLSISLVSPSWRSQGSAA